MDDKYGLIGAPIAHSLSPAMHNFWFEEYGISGDYRLYPVEKRDLVQAVSRIKEAGVKGFNVTFPHKTAILSLLDEVDEAAEVVGAVNTVVQTGGRLIGYNTDGIGFLKGLQRNFPSFINKRPSILVIGAGGAARSVALTLARSIGARVDICNRTCSKAVALSAACGEYSNSDALKLDQAEQQLDRYQVVINTTSIGLNPDADHLVIHLNRALPGTLFADLIYSPRRTAFLREAERLSHPVMNGLSMLVYQGALAFQKWTGVFPETVKMENHLIKMYLMS
ncbi:shikimate dehydrogenase [Sporolactobacillus sp. STCC-11]|uniref:shikimate dehydrogenase n=1 Tax=Sporolactobacillus caesalpiniae TaxID=3230362 RepID=UPI0033915A3A